MRIKQRGGLLPGAPGFDRMQLCCLTSGRVLGHNLADLSFKQDAQNVLHICWPGTGNTHLVTALEQDKAQAKRGELR